MAKVTIVVDGREYRVEEGRNLLHACLDHGLELPYFCWHPALGSVGACRQCAVLAFDGEGDREGSVVMACMTPAKDGARISIRHPEAEGFRRQVIEWLMVNHPHDCPVCDEGGECHLQDMTVMTGHAYRRARFDKRTHRNQYLGPFIHHEMNRCIQCYRCVRFYRDHAGGSDLDVFGAHDHVYFGRARDGVLESPFAGNLVEVCPTGVFTDRTLRRHYTRKWDLQSAPSVCVHCGLGCNTVVAEREGVLRRVLNRYHHEINGYFLCDRGRFGYEFVNHERRLRRPLVRRGGSLQEVRREDAIAEAARLLAGCDEVLGIGSPRATLESSFALRALVGPDRFVSGMTRRRTELARGTVEILRRRPAAVATLRQVESSDAVLVLGEDLLHSAPRAELAVRQSLRTAPQRECEALGVPPWHDAAVRDLVQGRTGPLHLLTPAPTTLDRVATTTRRAAPADIARVAAAVARALDADRPQVKGLAAADRKLAEEIAGDLRRAERPLVVSGSSLGSLDLLEAAAAVVDALGDGARLLLVAPECNTLGVALLGDGSLEEAAERVGGRRVGVVVVENDLLAREAALATTILERAAVVVVVDHLRTATVEAAAVALPAATFAEGSGTLVNHELRAQRSFAAMPPAGDARESWRWIRDLAAAMAPGEAPEWRVLDDVLRSLAESSPELAAAAEAAPGADFRLPGGPVPRQTPRASGRTAVRAHVEVSEGPPPEDPDTPLAFSMEGSRRRPPAALVPWFHAPGWSSVQAVNAFREEIAGPLRGGPAGVRLLDEGTDGSAPQAWRAPEAFAAESDRFLALPTFRVFGSEELSRLAPGVAELAPAGFVGLAGEDAADLGVEEGGAVCVEVGDVAVVLPVRRVDGLSRGTILLPLGLDGVPALDLPAQAVVRAEAGP